MILVLETSKNSGKKELVVNWHTALWLSQFHPNQFLTSHWACLEVFSIPCSTWMFFFSFGGILYIVFFPPETPYVHLGLWFTQISVFHRPDFGATGRSFGPGGGVRRVLWSRLFGSVQQPSWTVFERQNLGWFFSGRSSYHHILFIFYIT